MLFGNWCACGDEDCDLPALLCHNMNNLRPVRLRDSVLQYAPNTTALRSLNSHAARTCPGFVHMMQSTIPNAGIGSFATCNIPSNVNLGEYIGHIYEKDVERDWDDYMFEVDKYKGNPGFIVSARQYNSKRVNWTRFVNSVMVDGDSRQNTEYRIIKQKIYIYTTKYIKADFDHPQELFAYYGADSQNFIRD